MKIYVASSWRNRDQPAVVGALREAGHEVYDFKNPKEGDQGFHWKEVLLERDDRGHCQPADLRRALTHPRAVEGFASDFGAMKWADVGVLLLPCGRSAHLEAGWMAGAGKPTLVLAPPSGASIEPELMYGVTGRELCVGFTELLAELELLEMRSQANVAANRGRR